MKFHDDGALPTVQGSIFVFGSNLAGIHGAGAAKAAFESFGAVMGSGVGRRGMSYAIPTKDKRIRTLSKQMISAFVNDFCKYTHEHPELDFFITRVGCGLAGYKDKEIASLFKTANKNNCDFPADWKNFL